MAADATLVQGAREAYGYFGDRTDRAKQQLYSTVDKTLQDMSSSKEEELEAQQKEIKNKITEEEKKAIADSKAWQRATQGANDVLNGDGSLSADDTRLLSSLVAGPDGGEAFVAAGQSGDNVEQTVLLNDVGEWTNQINGVKAYKVENADLIVNANTADSSFNSEGYSLALQDYDEEKNLLSSHTGQNTISIGDRTNDNGERTGAKIGLNNNGEYMSLEDASDLSDSFRVDVESQANILEMQNEMASKASKGTKDDKFEYDSVRERISQIVSNSGQKLSLMYDPLVKSKSFKDDLYASGMLSNITYESLGIKAEDAYALEKASGEEKPDGLINDSLSIEDQNSIIKMFLKNPNLNKEREEMLVDYYTQLVQQSWNSKHQELVDIYNKNNPPAAKQMSPMPEEQKQMIYEDYVDTSFS